MTPGSRRPRAWSLLLAICFLLIGCAHSTARPADHLSYERLAPVPAGAKFAEAVDSAHKHGLRVWLESDLVERWKAGSASFNNAIAQLAALAARPGVVGIKIADELGDRDGVRRSTLMQFLRDARAALHTNAPGKLILIDIIGYQLSCVPDVSQFASQSAACDAHERAAHQGVTLDTIQESVDSGYVDVIELTTNMQDPAVYQSWGTTRAAAQQAAFAQVHRRGWDTKVCIQTRKALAFPTAQVPDARTAASLLPDFVDIPLAAGAKAVDIWTFSQFYDGRLVHLMDPGDASNVLWEALRARHRRGDVLFTHYSPTFRFGASVDADMQAIAQAFTDVFVAAGTG